MLKFKIVNIIFGTIIVLLALLFILAVVGALGYVGLGLYFFQLVIIMALCSVGICIVMFLQKNYKARYIKYRHAHRRKPTDSIIVSCVKL
ncbi:MAG: hypothetical protein FWG63_02575 [Defluviitaleaceae bacterium]|nr:hypothetical protein [Defluviitaleaceae bacterium]